jgi:hypothetical protein
MRCIRLRIKHHALNREDFSGYLEPNRVLRAYQGNIYPATRLRSQFLPRGAQRRQFVKALPQMDDEKGMEPTNGLEPLTC